MINMGLVIQANKPFEIALAGSRVRAAVRKEGNQDCP
jgi:hypothetical protein